MLIYLDHIQARKAGTRSCHNDIHQRFETEFHDEQHKLAETPTKQVCLKCRVLYVTGPSDLDQGGADQSLEAQQRLQALATTPLPACATTLSRSSLTRQVHRSDENKRASANKACPAEPRWFFKFECRCSEPHYMLKRASVGVKIATKDKRLELSEIGGCVARCRKKATRMARIPRMLEYTFVSHKVEATSLYLKESSNNVGTF